MAALDAPARAPVGRPGPSTPRERPTIDTHAQGELIDRPVTQANGDGRSHAYVPEIDGLRAIAVLAVMAYHLRTTVLPGGFVGVDVFFVISGYVVAGSLWRDAGRSLPGLLLHFYARRVVRILPALLAFLLVATAASVLFIPPSWLGDGLPSTARGAYLGVSNIVLRSVDTYFSPRAEFNPFTHTWSLAVEEQFYLLCPVLLFVWQRWRARPGPRAAVARLLMPAAAAASLAWLAATATGGHDDRAFYLLPGRFWELAAGVLLFQAQATARPATNRAARQAALALGLAAIAAAALFSDPGRFPYPWALLPVGGTLLVLAAVAPTPSVAHAPLAGSLARALRSRPATAIGRLSYSLYLWHWGVYVLLRWTTGLETPATVAAALALTIAAATACYRLVERPLRHAAIVRRAPKLAVVAAGLAAALLARQATTEMFRFEDALGLSVVKRDGPLWFPQPVRGVDGPGQCPVRTRIHPLPGGVAGVELDMRRDCPQPGPVRHRLFILGDSHALAYQTLASLLAREADIAVSIEAVAECPVANLLGPPSPACVPAVDAAIAGIAAEARPGDVLLLAALRAPRTSEQWGPVDGEYVRQRLIGPEADSARAGAGAEAERVLARLERIDGLHLVFAAPLPVFPAPVFRCVDWFDRGNPACRAGLTVARAEAQRFRAPVMAELDQLLRRFPTLTPWDPFDALCPGPVCDPAPPSGPLFVDGDHLSAHANRLLLPAFEAILRRAWPDGTLGP